jgi:hypothetical protein
MPAHVPTLGLGIGWRPELALALDRRADLGWIELVAEEFDPSEPLPLPIRQLRARGVRVVPHGLSLSLGGAEPIDRRRVDRLARLAEVTGAPLVSEHLAFVRAGGRETGHLLPLPRTRDALEVAVENIRFVQELLPVPLAIENIASLLDWPDNELEEADFLTEVLERTEALLLLDISNLYANCRNRQLDPAQQLDRLPLERLAYVHLGGGFERDGIYHDTHAAPVPAGALELLEQLAHRVDPPGVMLERDDLFPSTAELYAELDALTRAVARGRSTRECSHAG